MNEKVPNPLEQAPSNSEPSPEIVVNEYGSTVDPAVVFEKEPSIDIVPKNRPRRIYAGMWGRNEIVTVALGIFALLITILIYFFLVVPSNRELARHQTEAESLKRDRDVAEKRYGNITNTETQVTKLLSSEEDFELNHLPPVATGRNALYQRLNGLIDAYGLVNTSGPDYAPLETVDQGNNNQSDDERGRARFRSLFPGIYVTMTIEGTYQNLRRFIKEIETGQEFVVVSAVELMPSENQRQAAQPNQPQETNTRVPMQPNQPMGPVGPVQTQIQTQTQKGRTRGELVSLRLEMAAYFRRPNFVPTAQ